ncbi:MULTISPECIES: hypothetical protein [unclassified Streptomyces]|uniref:hypothetical protein n=1 Tax=unclassified Streptomyces TaxID=2593676 RepID=UPI00131C0F13|nr:hypothetical protein [Streptomyces sp. NRRL F-2747]
MTGRTPRTAGDRPSRTGTTAPWPRPGALRSGYLLTGPLSGAAWGVNRGMPVREHAVRLLDLVVGLAPAGRGDARLTRAITDFRLRTA